MYIYIDMYNITKIAPWLHGYEQVSLPKNNHGNKTNAPVPFVLI